MTTTKFDEQAAKDFLSKAAGHIAAKDKEDILRHNLTSYLPRMFPDSPWWVENHVSGSEAKSVFHKTGTKRRGFVDALVGSTAIEYEKDLSTPAIFDEGYGQVLDYCAGLLNDGIPPDLIIGVLSDTVRWKAYRIGDIKAISSVSGATAYGRDHITLEEIDDCNAIGAGLAEARSLGMFLEKHLGREGGRRLSANTLSADLGFESKFCEPHLDAISKMVDSAFSANPSYAGMIEKLWADFVSYLGGTGTTGGFDRATYAGELYILTLAKLICANILAGKALASSRDEIASIMNGEYFSARGLTNLVEYDYFGWLNDPPHVDSLVPVAEDIQSDLRAYDFASAPMEDIFGALMAQLARRSQRLLLGQEWTPAWLAEKLVGNVFDSIRKSGQEPRLVDMCCGSGAMIVEVVKRTKAELSAGGIGGDNPEALSKLSGAVTGFDIDPLAVMLAKIGWVLAAKDWLVSAAEVSIPVYHADSLFAATPLTKVVDESGASHHALRLDDKDVNLPAFLISPDRRALFDRLLDRGYAMAMASAKNDEAGIVRDDVETLVHDSANTSGSVLSADERALTIEFCYELLCALEALQRAGRNGIWAFVLRNSYRPGLVAGKFNGLVSNPPWLALSKVGNNPYKDALRKKAEDYSIKPAGPSHLHIEMATIFLLHAVDRYLSDGAAVGCVLPESILSAHHHNPFRIAAYANGTRPIKLSVDELWRVGKGTFKNEAVVLFGAKSVQTPSSGIKGKDVSKGSFSSTTFNIIVRGNRSAWSDNAALGSGSGFFSPAGFRQGADVMPRTLVFHGMTRVSPSGPWNVTPIGPASPERYLKADAKKHVNFSITAAGVSDKVVYDVLMSNHLTPFDVSSGAKGLLPISRGATGVWTHLPATSLAALGTPTASAFKTILGALGNISTSDYFALIETDRKKLTNQTWGGGWLVFMGAGGSNVCAAYAPCSRFPTDKTVVDQTLYWVEVPSEDEAIYLTGLLNSDAINTVICEFQPRGQFGERHIHKLPLGVTPPYNPMDPAHADVVVHTKLLIADWNACKIAGPVTIQPLLSPNSSTLAVRRRKIKAELKALPSWPAYELACRTLYCV